MTSSGVCLLWSVCGAMGQCARSAAPGTLSALVACLLASTAHPQTTFPNDDKILKWSDDLERKLSDLVLSATSVETARASYKSDSKVTLEEISGEAILDSVLRDMGILLGRKRKALQRLVQEAERNVEYVNIYAPMLNLEDVPFFNMKMPDPSYETPFSDKFRQRVSFEQSGVHIPMEVFDGWMGPRYKEHWWHDPQILNGLNWSQTLDAIFKENYEQDPTMSWQYFGSIYGFMRVYPAFRWPDHPSLPDLFDVRRRSWYVQGAVSPKDMIILIDRSGSVHGQTLDIMKITVRALLNSLGENDYVNVAWFNNEVRWVIPCMNTLVQATAQNRRLLSDAVERLTESNFTSYATALAFAFDAFRKFDEERRPWGGSNCHKAIMFLSDGGTDWPEELVTQHCNQSRTGRIKLFTFACGPHPIPTVVLKEMACATGGYFSPITALGSVRIKIQDYVRVLSRPVAHAAIPDLFQWHNFYRDIGGLGMMTTITLPVYSKRPNETDWEDRLLGVMGVDVPVDEMKSVYPKHKLGPFGYPFSINRNGFVVFHPRLRDHIVYIEDPPDVDLTDLEGQTEGVVKMRQEMIDGKKGELLNYTSLVPAGMGHAITVNMNYYYGAVDGADFRFGVAIPSGEVRARFPLKNISREAGLLESLDGLHIAPWGFCSNGETHDDIPPMELAERIAANFSLCNANKVAHLIWDASHASAVQDAWRKNPASGVYSRFLMTAGGLSLLQPTETLDGTRRQLDPYRSALYKWSSRTPRCVLSVARGRSYDVSVACRVIYKRAYVAGVIGVEMERSLVQDVLNDLSKGHASEINCGDSHVVHCYLLNDGGVVIASNQHEVRAGTFIGQQDPQLLKFLMDRKIIGSEHRFNYHSWCSKQPYQVQTVGSVSSADIIHAFWNAFVSLRVAFFFDSLLVLLSSFALWTAVESKEPSFDANNQSCVTRSSWYHLINTFSCQEDDTQCETNARILHAGMFYCPTSDGTCQREIRARFLPNVTGVFVVAAPKCDCATPVPLQHVDPQDVGPDHCDIRQPYRRRSSMCFAEMPTGNSTDCGAGPAVSTSASYSFHSLVDLFVISVASTLVLSSN